MGRKYIKSSRMCKNSNFDPKKVIKNNSIKSDYDIHEKKRRLRWILGSIFIILFALVISILSVKIESNPIVENEIVGRFIRQTQDSVKADNSIENKSIKMDTSKKKIKKKWVHFSSNGQNKEVKITFDKWVKKWTKGKLSNDSLKEKIMNYLEDNNMECSTIGIVKKRKCLFESIKSIPNYSKIVKTSDDIYYFVGLYTEGKYAKYGNLIRYYWEVGVM